MIPERKLNGWVYFWHRPNMKLSAGGIALWDPTGEDVYDSIFFELDEHMALPADAQVHQFTLDNSLVVECTEALKSYHFTFDRNGCTADLRFDAFTEPFQPGGTATDGWIVPVSELHTGHYDQFGRMHGSIVVEGEPFQIDDWSIRDRSWGPRIPGSGSNGGYLWGVASRDTYFYLIAIRGTSPADDPVRGTTEQVRGGFFVQDGIVGEFVSGERRVVERGADGRPLREVIEAKDSLGRTFHAEGLNENWLHWPSYGCLFTWSSLTHWNFAGQSGWGEAHDYLHSRAVRRYHRSLPVEARLPGGELTRRVPA